MDEQRMPGGILPETETDGGHAFTAGPPEHDSATLAAIPVVGIGASAGGLKVFKRLLGLLPSDTGFAIVFVQHLNPNHRSMPAEILAQATAMPVSEAADGMPVEANHVYAIPANVDLTIAHGALNLVPRTQTRLGIECVTLGERGRICPSTGSFGRWPTSAEAGQLV
jgi:chemotaxis response regulator CheB